MSTFKLEGQALATMHMLVDEIARHKLTVSALEAALSQEVFKETGVALHDEGGELVLEEGTVDCKSDSTQAGQWMPMEIPIL